MTWLLFAMAILLLGAMAVLLLGRPDRNVSWFGAGSVVIASVLGCVPVIQVLSGGSIEAVRVPWPVPFGEFFIELDPLAAWFLFPTLLLSALSAIYGVGYLRVWQGRRSLGPVWFFYCVLVLGMMLVLLARNAVLFLIAWELMALASFFLVTFEHERESVREAGWIYFVATHLGTAFLLAFFLLLGRDTGSMDFTVWAEKGVQAQGLASILFLLAVIGFGTKAGFMPLHVWLPEAHPAAPSHVSALMSGVMIKTGIYGLLRALTFLGTPAYAGATARQGAKKGGLRSEIGKQRAVIRGPWSVPLLGVALPNPRIEVSALFHGWKFRQLPPYQQQGNVTIDLRFATLLRELGLPARDATDALDRAVLSGLAWLQLQRLLAG